MKRIVLLFSLALLAAGASAQSWPTKPMRLIVPFPRFAAIGAEVLPTTPEEFAAFIRAEHARWGEVIRRAGIKVEQ